MSGPLVVATKLNKTFRSGASSVHAALFASGGLQAHRRRPNERERPPSPAGFLLGDIGECAQRNLNDKGKELARQFGEALRRATVPVSEVYTSKYNRARC
jgi:hypothetical protein